MSAGRCIHCQGPIDEDQDYRKVIGWERRRSAGGTNAIKLREPLDDWACRWCVEKQVKGLAPSQGALL